jgi:hypothetical protein
MNVRMIVALVLSMIVSAVCVSAAPLNDALPKALGRCVVRLQHREVTSRPGQAIADTIDRPDGTAFIVRYKDVHFLVTAKHVANVKYDLWARVSTQVKGTDTIVVGWVEIPRRGWVFHPESTGKSQPLVDVAVCRINDKLISLDRVHKSFVFMGIQQELFDSSEVLPLQQVVVAGYPADLGFQLVEQTPLFRQGIVAFSADSPFMKIDNDFADARDFLIDCRIFEGNSGSPVFVTEPLGGSIHLSGLVVATSHNLDFGVAEPTSRILETLERALTLNQPDSLMARIRPIWEL